MFCRGGKERKRQTSVAARRCVTLADRKRSYHTFLPLFRLFQADVHFQNSRPALAHTCVPRVCVCVALTVWRDKNLADTSHRSPARICVGQAESFPIWKDPNWKADRMKFSRIKMQKQKEKQNSLFFGRACLSSL